MSKKQREKVEDEVRFHRAQMRAASETAPDSSVFEHQTPSSSDQHHSYNGGFVQIFIIILLRVISRMARVRILHRQIDRVPRKLGKLWSNSNWFGAEVSLRTVSISVWSRSEVQHPLTKTLEDISVNDLFHTKRWEYIGSLPLVSACDRSQWILYTVVPYIATFANLSTTLTMSVFCESGHPTISKHHAGIQNRKVFTHLTLLC